MSDELMEQIGRDIHREAQDQRDLSELRPCYSATGLEKFIAKHHPSYQLVPSSRSAAGSMLKDETYLQCSGCGRKQYSPAVLESTCGMSQPDGSFCKGIMQGKSNVLNS